MHHWAFYTFGANVPAETWTLVARFLQPDNRRHVTFHRPHFPMLQRWPENDERA